MQRHSRPSRPVSLTVALALAVSILLSGCGTFDGILQSLGIVDTPSSSSAENLAADALDLFNTGKYSEAFATFEKLKDRYPFSEYSMLASLKMADSKYYLKAYGEAAVLYEEFENNHPNNEAVPYVMFQIGMCHFQQIASIDRDPGSATLAIQAFSKLLRAVPISPYTEEAKARIGAARDFLAFHEFYVADYYIRTDELKQAEGRLDYLLATYPDTAAVPAAQNLLAAIRSDKPPKRSWKSWLPEISIPTWKSITESLTYGQGAPAGN